jgi:nuclear-control-of-ATPase protein 2
MTTFSGRQTEKLLSEVVPPTISSSSNLSENQRGLQAHLLALNPPIAGASTVVNDALLYLQKLQTGTPYASRSFKVNYATSDVDDLDTKLALGVLSRVAVTLYAQILEEHLAQASSAEREAEWWADVERSHLSTLQYLIQSMCIRMMCAA